MKKVLVAGATGYLGLHVAREFKRQGYWVRALVRDAGRLENLGDSIDDVFIGQATDPASLRGVCEGIDIAFSSVGITRQKDNLTYMEVDFQANMNLLAEAQREGVARFIYISSFNAERLDHLKCIQAKLKFTQELKGSGLNYLVVYPNGFFADMLAYLQMARKGRGWVFGSGEWSMNPIHGEDLAQACVAAAAGEETDIYIGGPVVLSHNQILMVAFGTLSKRVKISRVPLWVRNGLLAVLRRCTSEKTYGPLELWMTFAAMDMVAPTSGRHHLREYFWQNKDRV